MGGNPGERGEGSVYGRAGRRKRIWESGAKAAYMAHRLRPIYIPPCTTVYIPYCTTHCTVLHCNIIEHEREEDSPLYIIDIYIYKLLI